MCAACRLAQLSQVTQLLWKWHTRRDGLATMHARVGSCLTAVRTFHGVVTARKGSPPFVSGSLGVGTGRCGSMPIPTVPTTDRGA